jgi:hypothetical protein
MKLHIFCDAETFIECGSGFIDFVAKLAGKFQ